MLRPQFFVLSTILVLSACTGEVAGLDAGPVRCADGDENCDVLDGGPACINWTEEFGLAEQRLLCVSRPAALDLLCSAARRNPNASGVNVTAVITNQGGPATARLRLEAQRIGESSFSPLDLIPESRLTFFHGGGYAIYLSQTDILDQFQIEQIQFILDEEQPDGTWMEVTRQAAFLDQRCLQSLGDCSILGERTYCPEE